MSDLRYLYAIASARASAAIAGSQLRGIEGGRVEAIVEGALLGATSVVPASEYEEGPLNERLQDLEWLAPRAALHQDVNAKLLELVGTVLPLTFGAIYRGAGGVRALLQSRAEDLQRRLGALEGRAEWIVAVERDTSEGGFASLVPPAGDSTLQALDADIGRAAPGRAFLLGKKRSEVARDERRSRDAAIERETAAAIEAAAERVFREPLIDDAESPAIARFSVLAPREGDADLAAAVGALNEASAARGYRVRLSGPWPAYRFGGLPSDRLASS